MRINSGRLLTSRPVTGRIAELLDDIAQHENAYADAVAGDATGNRYRLTVAADALISRYRQLATAIQVRAYPAEPNTDDRLEQVVITVHGVDLSTRGRDEDLFVHIDTGDRDPKDAERYPLVLEVNCGGENEYR